MPLTFKATEDDGQFLASLKLFLQLPESVEACCSFKPFASEHSFVDPRELQEILVRLTFSEFLFLLLTAFQGITPFTMQARLELIERRRQIRDNRATTE